MREKRVSTWLNAFLAVAVVLGSMITAGAGVANAGNGCPPQYQRAGGVYQDDNGNYQSFSDADNPESLGVKWSKDGRTLIVLSHAPYHVKTFVIDLLVVTGDIVGVKQVTFVKGRNWTAHYNPPNRYVVDSARVCATGPPPGGPVG